MSATIDMRGRRGRPWRRLQAIVYASETHCHLCGQPVDQRLPRGHPQSRSVDHLTPLARGGHPLARDNVHLAHLACNSSKGKGTPPQRTELTW